MHGTVPDWEHVTNCQNESSCSFLMLHRCCRRDWKPAGVGTVGTRGACKGPAGSRCSNSSGRRCMSATAPRGQPTVYKEGLSPE